jgi:hypothetical protein
VGDLIRQVVSFLASETILERRREPMSSLLCWYCTRSQQKSPEINAKSVRCDSYHDQVPEEEVPFVRREPDYKLACTLRRFMCRVFAERSSITGKKVGKICVERAILRPATMSRYRQAEHLRDTENPGKVALIQSLRAQGHEPKLLKLEEVAGEKAHEREHYWTSSFKRQGYKIINQDYGSLSG